MSIKNNLLALILMIPGLMLCDQVAAQLSCQPLVPQVGLVQKNQLWNISFTSVFAEPVDVTVNLHVYDRVNDYLVLAGYLTPVSVKPGGQTLGIIAASGVVYTFLGNSSAWPATGLLPAGLYKACYQVRTADGKNLLLAEECVTIDVEALVPPQLVYPEDSAALNTQYPQFVWLPPAPTAIFTDLQYDLSVVEVLPGQSAQEAVQRNMPIYSASGLHENTAEYASSFSMLDTGRLYAWQVVCRNGYAYGAKSEAWVFKILQPRDSLPLSNGVFLQLGDNSGIYQNKGDVLFVKYNSYDKEHTTQLAIYGPSGEKIRHVSQRVVYGTNYFAIKLPAGQFKEDEVYSVRLISLDGKPSEARFSITEE